MMPLQGGVDNLSRRPRDGKISGNGFSDETLVANDPGGNVGISVPVHFGRYHRANAGQVDDVMLLKGETPTAVRPAPAICR